MRVGFADAFENPPMRVRSADAFRDPLHSAFVTVSPRERFAAIAAGPDAQIDLGEAALWIAAEAYPDLDVSAYLLRLDALAAEARPCVERATSERARVDALNDYLFEEQGFEGNREHYEDPRNSYLNQVLDRRTGIPISLSLLWIEVGRRLDLPVHGVGFPGHFLAKYQGADQIVVDPFFGRVLSSEDCVERLRQASGERVPFDPKLLEATGSREILARMLRNLKQHYARLGDLERALASCDRILLLLPDDAEELRDRGLVYRELECFGPAVADLERFVALVPGHPMARAVRSELLDLRRRVAEIH
jgi:regulator of sirC expression with transglutaminase-like and TPR domain